MTQFDSLSRELLGTVSRILSEESPKTDTPSEAYWARPYSTTHLGRTKKSWVVVNGSGYLRICDNKAQAERIAKKKNEALKLKSDTVE